ncbi:MAG: PstS family phosphate ABC transporter substrate-binding protein [Deltaproteobacteria bacterium]|nr:PstS family phosphate ABC transporter substrate-binding protein [Deltaproteobacteria bacterium]
MNRQTGIAAVLAAALLPAAGVPSCRKSSAATVKVDGSSTVYPITEAVAEEYGKTKPDVQVTVGISGTGGGFKKFCAGETDLSDASRPIKPSEIEACRSGGVEYIELPVAYDGIAIVVNPGNDWAQSITVEELKIMWAPEAQGAVTKWSDVRPGWPDRPLNLFGPGVDSGTYDYFTEAIVGKEHSSRGDFTSSEDDNTLVQGVAGDDNALGFFGFAYWAENKDKLKLLPVDDGKAENGDGPVAAALETIRDGTYQPLSRPLFVYVAVKSLDRPEVAAFARYFLHEGIPLVSEVGYVPLPEAAYPLALARLEVRKTGSMFTGGSQVGVTIDRLLAQEAE